MSMDIHRLHGWAEFMDKATVASLVVVVIGVAALVVTSWLSARFSAAVRFEEQAAIERYKDDLARHASELQQDLNASKAQNARLQDAVADADQRATQAIRENATANQRAAALENDAAQAKKRADELEKRVGDAKSRSVEPEKATDARGDAKGDAKGRADGADEARPAAEDPAKPRAKTDPQKSQIVTSLSKFAGTKAAVYVVEEAPEATTIGFSINSVLSDAGWASSVWNWTGVSGILGVVVLVRQGSDSSIEAAAATFTDTLRSAGFNAAQGGWPADWRKYRGTLTGPQTPAPTDAPIRIVIGAKAH
jgi:hypothetical protein